MPGENWEGRMEGSAVMQVIYVLASPYQPTSRSCWCWWSELSHNGRTASLDDRQDPRRSKGTRCMYLAAGSCMARYLVVAVSSPAASPSALASRLSASCLLLFSPAGWFARPLLLHSRPPSSTLLSTSYRLWGGWPVSSRYPRPALMARVR
jgi:hypothetical protein